MSLLHNDAPALHCGSGSTARRRGGDGARPGRSHSCSRLHLGAIIAGQVFDRYPEPLPLRRVANEVGVSEQQLWDVARKQRPVSRATLQTSGDLLCALGQAFLQQRYGAILESRLAETNGRFRLLVEGVRDYALFTMDPAGCVT